MDLAGGLLGIEVVSQPAMPITSHVHAGMELGICVEGKNMRHFRECSFEVQSGQVWLAGVWEPHAWSSSATTSKVTVFFVPSLLWDPVDPDPTWLRMFAVSPPDRPQARSPETRERILAIAREVVEEQLERRPGWQRVCRLALMRVLMILEREWQVPAQRREVVSADYLARISPAMELVNAERHRRVPVVEAATRCGLSPSRFQDVFRRTIGLPYGQFSLRARLAHVAEQLLSTDFTLDRIADDSGFTDARHLRRMFRSEYGCTPTEYRRQQLPAVWRP